MTDRRLPDLPAPAPLVMPPFSSLPGHHDESLMLSALARWRACCEGLRELFAGVPSIRDTVDGLLRQQLDLDGVHAGLLLPATGAQPERFISLTHACAFAFQHPQLDSALAPHWRITGLPRSHSLSSLTPRQMLERLKTLNPEQAHNRRWRDFWSARAPGTAVSRQTRAVELYRNHFEAAVHLAFARKALTAQQLGPLLSIIDPEVETTPPNAPPLRTEQLALVLSNQSRLKLTGAWAISRGPTVDGEHWLYLPSHPVAIQAFGKRSDLEDWLTRQGLVPQGLPNDNLSIEYSAKSAPMPTGASDLFANHQQAQISALRNGTRGKTNLAEQGAQSLLQADEVDRQRGNSPVIASPPRLDVTQHEDRSSEQPLFGSLYADIPWSSRQAALNRQRDALDRLIVQVGNGTGLQPLKDCLNALEKAEQDADKAAVSLLHRPRAASSEPEFTALHSAHRAGLKAEAAVQRLLGQLSDDEHHLLMSVLERTDTAPVAASLSLSAPEQIGDTPRVVPRALDGVFVVSAADAHADADSPHSVLIYWPGNGGGLQRFANRRELERVLVKMTAAAKGATLQWQAITGDALEHGLKQLTKDFEKRANAIADDAPQRAERLETLRVLALATLQVPVHAARNLAFAHRLEQDRSAALADHLPDWLQRLPVADRGALKALIEAYLKAMKRSHELLTLALEPRSEFTRKHLQARLRQDFSVKGAFDVQLDIPDAVTWETRYSAGPTGPVRTTVMVASATRSRMSLEALAQLNIDSALSVQQDPLSQRLVLMHREITADNDKERIRLLNGITPTYLRKILPELDLPKAYEQQILDAFKGALSEPVFVREHRRESLIEPWRLMLKLQGECARLQKQIDSEELQILNIAIDANTPAGWRAHGKRIVLLPARLSAGGKDTSGEGPSTLSGVTFIEEQVSGVTLLYLPDGPDGRFLRRYDSREAARKALFNLCQQDRMIRYLAGRALGGDARAHESRLNEAVRRYFDGMIEIGAPWPASTSLAAHLLDAHMGRLIIAHRDTSRSNAALSLERYALEGPRAFNYIKMALGVVPFVGTAIALYDAWNAANQAVAAFLRGNVGDGLAELQTVLLCLIDAAMDLLPGEAATSSLATEARQLTRTRQWRALTASAGALQPPSMRKARQVVARFAGYEYEHPIALVGLQPATHGLYRNVYRHPDGDFIVRQGRVFQVQLSKDLRQWRLFGNSRKTYKQPIALDEAGQWDTWFGVYGTTFDGGGLGGGNVLGHVANALDPIWPDAIRQRLPRWWADQAFRRHHALTEAADELAVRINDRVKLTDTALAAYRSAPPERLGALMQAAETACSADIEMVGRHYQTLADLLPLTHGNKRRALLEFQSNDALLMTDRYKLRLIFASHRADPVIDRMDALTAKLDTTPAEAFADRMRLLEDIRKLRLEILQAFDTIEARRRDLNLWYQRITISADKAHMTREVSELSGRLNDTTLLYLRTGHLLETVTRYDATSEVSWLLLQNQAMIKRDQVDRAFFTQFSLPEVTATRAQRNQILQDCIDQYSRFRRDLQAWTASYPQHFHLDAVPTLLDCIDKMTERARKALDLPPPAAAPGVRRKKVFVTEDDQLLIGVERTTSTSGRPQYTVTGQGGYNEIWELAANGKSRLLNPRTRAAAAVERNLESLVAEARQRLDSQETYLTRVQAYASQNMLPVDLEHMMLSEANELSQRARSIETLAPQNPIIVQLRGKATELTATGRAMRTRQSLQTRQPTDGMLADLVDQKAVEIRKTRPIANLGKRRDGRSDFMQEYEIWDLTQTPAKVLWYAHFHYAKASAALGAFEKAHLKLPEHRFLTHADNADLPYADIGKKSAVLSHFEKL